MESTRLAEYGRPIRAFIAATTRHEIEVATDRLVADQVWDLCGSLLCTAAELGARVLVAKLLELDVYEPLVVGATMRRQLKPAHMQERRGAAARRIFRDIDMETDEKGIPDHIQAELDDLQAVAEEARDIADRREAARDADPVRALIVNRLAEKVASSDEALDAMVAIAEASGFEDTRRSAALKLVTHPTAVKRLDAADRVADLVAIANCCGLDSAAQKVAETLAPRLDALLAEEAKDALALIGKYHPDPTIREKALKGAQ
jgi:hypothetical protein